MGEVQRSIERIYELAKAGDWVPVLSMWRDIPSLAQQCSRFQKSTSGWTFLHQAAYFGHEIACRELIRLGADVGLRSKEGKQAADVAQDRNHDALADVLRQASKVADSLWSAPSDPDLLPSSNLWWEASQRRATHPMRIAYGGGIVHIPAGSRYFVDSFGRTLVGWHGTYDPPCGMEGDSMLRG